MPGLHGSMRPELWCQAPVLGCRSALWLQMQRICSQRVGRTSAEHSAMSSGAGGIRPAFSRVRPPSELFAANAANLQQTGRRAVLMRAPAAANPANSAHSVQKFCNHSLPSLWAVISFPLKTAAGISEKTAEQQRGNGGKTTTFPQRTAAISAISLPQPASRWAYTEAHRTLFVLASADVNPSANTGFPAPPSLPDARQPVGSQAPLADLLTAARRLLHTPRFRTF